MWEEWIFLLESYNIPIIDSMIVKKLSDAEKFFNIYKKIVIKLYTPQVLHKTEEKLVYVCENQFALHRAFINLTKKQKWFNGDIVVQAFVDGLPLIIGGKHDSTFGPVIMVGAGGIYTEVLGDVSFRLAPVSLTEANKMIKELKSYKLIRGVRGKKYDINTLTKTIVNVSKLLVKEKVKEIDLNPFILLEKGGFAVDIRILS